MKENVTPTHDSVYRRVAIVAGVPVRCDPIIKSWGGWPEDVEPTLKRWNKGVGGHTLSFYTISRWGGFDTGFAALTKKCSECEGFFNQTNAGWLDKRRWVCDDCLIVLAREAQ